MNVTTTSFSPTQTILAWTLLILLLSWFIIFAALALRVFIIKKDEWEDSSSPSRPIQIIGAQPKEEHTHSVEMFGVTTHHEHTHSESPADSTTPLIR